MGLDFCHDREDLDAYVSASPDLFPPEAGYAKGIQMLSPLEFPAVVDELSGLGDREPELAKILDGNRMRVARQTWV